MKYIMNKHINRIFVVLCILVKMLYQSEAWGLIVKVMRKEGE